MRNALLIFLCTLCLIQTSCEKKTTDTPMPTPIATINGQPVTGTQISSLAAFDQAITQYMNAHSISGATLAVSYNGKLVLSHGYGYSDTTDTLLVQPTTRMRIASITKVVTAALVRNLIAKNGGLSLSTQAFSYLGSQAYNNTLGDSRINVITVGQLLSHTSGWDGRTAPTGSGFDPMFSNIVIANVLAKPNPVGQSDIIRYMLSQTLQHNPGSTYAYSNFGYCVLGRIIEKFTGMSYISALKSLLLQPLGLDTDVDLGASLASGRLSGEVQNYADMNYMTNSVFAPTQMVAFPYGGFYVEAMDSHGGLVTSAPTLVALAQNYWADGTVRFGNGGGDWYFFGSLPGTYTLLRWRNDGVNFAILFNQRQDSNHLGTDAYQDIKSLLDQVSDGITSWP